MSHYLKTKKKSQQRGFSLVEILVAVTITSLMLVTLAQMMSVISKSWLEGVKRVDNYAKARATMDLITRDLQAGVFRSDLGAFRNDGGQPAFAFFVKRPSAGTEGNDRRLSLISYVEDKNEHTIKRASTAIGWSADNSAAAMNFSSLATNLKSIPFYAALPSSPEQMDDIAEGILRAEMYFIDKEGEYQYEYTEGCKVVGITIAVMDQQTLKLMKKAFPAKLDDLTDTGGAFRAPSLGELNSGVTYQSKWEEAMNEESFFNGYPPAARTSIRLMERFVYLP